MSKELAKLRARIDALDLRLLGALNERARLAAAVGKLKQGNKVYRPEREAQVLRRILEKNAGPLGKEALARVYAEIISACRALEQPLAVSYLGPAGTFSEMAVRKVFGSGVRAQPCASIDEVFRQAETGAVDYGVVPVENSSEGAIGRTHDLLLSTPLRICAETVLRVRQNLMSKSDSLKKIVRVYSHAQSLAQCNQWLSRKLPDAERVPVASNSEAARLAAEEAGAAAIAGDIAVQRHGLKLVARNIEDDPNNTTRFLVLGEHDAAPSGKDLTSIVMSAPNRPGAVHALLTPIARHGVSMSRLESRPARTGRWEYMFYVDVQGHRQDPKVAKALAELDKLAPFLKILGSYPAAVL
ncbi:MAG: chorismate mutase [Betaproteobacteria bacterium RIFCSPLOWO2_12_FULL_66_14]|nr:MAG: chorismate mutase [Betaproteobacteria bacterium RIFCSPLOWO2_12_FULL_66_14]